MKKAQSRRNFLKQGTVFCITCVAITACPGVRAASFLNEDDEIPDPKDLEYCGYRCPADCPMYLATINNDETAKKKAFEDWQLEERYGLKFDPEQLYCYTCKPGEKPVGTSAQHCEVRNCAIEKELDCCIECKDLPSCTKGVFSRYPDFHKGVVKLQEKYTAAHQG